MKMIKNILAFAVAGILLVSCKKQENTTIASEKNPDSENAVIAKLATTSFNIDGMTCAVGCAKTIEKELSETKGVKTATVDFDKKTAKVEYFSNEQSPEKLVQIVQKTGDGTTYKVSNVINSQDKAMLFDQDDKKQKEKKSKNKEKATTYTTTNPNGTATAEPEKAEVKPACCKSKKHCSSESM